MKTCKQLEFYFFASKYVFRFMFHNETDIKLAERNDRAYTLQSVFCLMFSNIKKVYRGKEEKQESVTCYHFAPFLGVISITPPKYFLFLQHFSNLDGNS